MMTINMFPFHSRIHSKSQIKIRNYPNLLSTVWKGLIPKGVRTHPLDWDRWRLVTISSRNQSMLALLLGFSFFSQNIPFQSSWIMLSSPSGISNLAKKWMPSEAIGPFNIRHIILFKKYFWGQRIYTLPS